MKSFGRSVRDAIKNAKIIMTEEMIQVLRGKTSVSGALFKPGDKLLTCMEFDRGDNTMRLLKYTQDELQYLVQNYEYFQPLMDDDFIPNETIPFIIVKKAK